VCWARGNIYGLKGICDGLGVIYMGERVHVLG